MSYLPAYYEEVNLLNGHQYNCAYGAGADCGCGAINLRHGHAKNCTFQYFLAGDADEECTCDKFPLFQVVEDGVRLGLFAVSQYDQALEFSRRRSYFNDSVTLLLRVNSEADLSKYPEPRDPTVA